MTDSVLPLQGIRIVALEQAVAAPLCTRHLADLGADVIKVEPPGGEFGRRYDEVVNGDASYFVWLNGGKRSIVLDLKTAPDKATFERLLNTADVFVHNLGPGAVDRLGFGWEPLHRRWPTLISCAISGYGMDGPYRDRKAFDLLLQGESGVTSITGSQQEAAKVGVSIGDIAAGMYALSTILAALMERQQTGMGRLVDISMLECLAEWMSAPAYYQRYRGQTPARAGLRHSAIVPYGPFRLGDGSLANLAVQNDRQWQHLCEGVLERADLYADERFRTNELRVRNRHVLEPVIEEILAGLAPDEVTRRLERADVPFGALNDIAGLLEHPQLNARGRWGSVQTPHGAAPALEHPLNIVGLSRPPRAVPSVGEHASEILAELAADPPAPKHRK
jgi:itaconate CoA-transferase